MLLDRALALLFRAQLDSHDQLHGHHALRLPALLDAQRHHARALGLLGHQQQPRARQRWRHGRHLILRRRQHRQEVPARFSIYLKFLFEKNISKSKSIFLKIYF